MMQKANTTELQSPQKTSTNEGSTTEQAMDRTTHLTKYMFRSPEPFMVAAYILIFSMVAGFLIDFDLQHLDNNFSIEQIYNSAIILGLFLIGMPAILSCLISTPAAGFLGGDLPYRRSFLLAFVSIIILVCILLIGKLLAIWFEINFWILMIFGYALMITLRHPVILATSNHRHLGSLPSSINQTILGFLFIYLVPNSIFRYTLEMSVFMLGFTVIFLGATLLWLHIVIQPFRRNFDVNGLLLMKHSLTQFSKNKKSDHVLENEFFSRIGTDTNLRVGIVGFKDPAENYQTTKISTLLVIPSVHLGPFGVLGGSDLPLKLSKYLKGLTSNLMVFHGPATHDQNPVATGECKKIARVVRDLTIDAKYSERASTFQRIQLDSASTTTSTVTSTSKTRHRATGTGLNICAQRFGNGTVYIHTSSPESTDDIDNSTGEAIVQKAEHETGNHALFIDAHNCLEPGTGEVHFGSKKANDMVDLVTKLNEKMQDLPEHNISTGFAGDRRFTRAEGLGAMGIQVLVIRNEPVQLDDQLELDKPQKKKQKKNNKDNACTGIKTNAYILLDGNNVIPGLREHILNAISDRVDDAEVFTTDNHVVNATMGGYNPVGLKLGQKKVIDSVRRLVDRAIENCKPSMVCMNSKILKNIRILGKNTPLRISATINATISIMRGSLVACQGLAIGACYILVTLI